MSSERLQRVGPFVSLAEVLGRYGVALDIAAEGTGVDPALLVDQNAIIPFRAACRLIQRAALLSGCRDIGLQIGMLHDFRSLGVVGQLMQHAPTLGDAILDFVRNQHRNSRGAVVYLMQLGDAFNLGYGIYERHEPGADQIYDVAIAIAVNTIRRLAGPRAGPVEVLLCHRGVAPRAHYEAVLGCPVRLNQPHATVVVSSEAMRLPIPGANAVMRQQLAAIVEAALSLGKLDFAAHVRHVLKPGILLGDASAERIARQIGVHIRTLNRRLHDEGTNFRAIEQDVRYATACELLSLTDLDISDISAALSYGTPSAFDRAFRRWASLSPTAWRQQDAARWTAETT
ncbi:AraC family transcriptional regulator [Mesorhizobium sp. BR1-1-16]|uniref:AraC family transcriptional regulator n=1 Tax=Mesorhizobium sp. BR1-1-16 TaxID=2876653 RepID=UPI001CCD2BDD|nr:AraC family transcriptional regulator [Mesorhizobium sp. BR1-1-16]MBZ9936781.1 AraC family transcriptional regulator [Mesorhizobium sp. BR1-1-16]